MLTRIVVIFFLISIFALPAMAKDKAKVYVIRKPKPVEEEVKSTYTNEDLEFGLDLREGFTFTESKSEDGAFTLTIELKDYPIAAALTTELLDEELTSLGYWRLMQERDPTIEENLAYERPVEVAGIPGMQVRIEGSGQNAHFLIMSLVFTSGKTGYILSCFAESTLFDKVPDFLDEISDGFYFLEEDDDTQAVDGSDEAPADEKAGTEEG